MSRQGMKAALLYGEDLPSYASQSEAESALIELKDFTLAALISEVESDITLDFSPESLKALEKWYFDAGRPNKGRGNYSMSHAIGFYYGELLCRQADFTWIVEEFPFKKGHFGIGVRRPFLKIMLTKGMAPQTEGNKRMQSLWRNFNQYAH